MEPWDELSENERAARRVAWYAANGDVRRWRRWVESGPLSDRWQTADAPEDWTRLTDYEGLELCSDGIDAIDASMDAYPEGVRGTVDAPGLLWVDGTIPRGRSLAVVGTRAVDFEGVRLAKEIVRGIARAGVVIVSGGARGVDTVAHAAALAVGTPTVAFLPGGLDRLTPRSNLGLFDRIRDCGALLTEYPPDVGAHRFHFRRRNELIAAFADAVLVVRSKQKGGTMLTARAAQRQGRPLFVVPGSPEDDTSAGCLQLLREGARPIRSAEDLLDDMGWTQAVGRSPEQGRLIVSEDARSILDAIEVTATLDDLVRRTQLPVAKVHAALLELEIAGYVQKQPGSAFYRSSER